MTKDQGFKYVLMKVKANNNKNAEKVAKCFENTSKVQEHELCIM